MAGLNCEDLWRKAIHGVQQHSESDADNIENFCLCQNPQSSTHEGVFRGHVLIGSRIDRPAAALPNQEQAEGQCLGEGRGKQDVKVPSRISTRLGMRVENGLELRVNIKQRIGGCVGRSQFCQTVLNDPANQPR